MTLQPKELFGAEVPQKPALRAFPYEGGISPGTLAAYEADADGDPIELPHLTPLAFDSTGDQWAVWDDATVDEVFTISSGAVPATAGTFTLTVLGQTTSALDFDSTAAEIDTALEALSTVPAGGVTCTATAELDLGVANAIVTIAFAGGLAGVSIGLSADFSALTGGPHVLENTVDGSGAATNQIDGFLWKPESEGHMTSPDGETLVQILRRGQVHADDVPLPVTGVQTQAALDAALEDPDLRQKGLDIKGIPGIH